MVITITKILFNCCWKTREIECGCVFFVKNEEGMVYDLLPDEHLFIILVISLWFADTTNYLVVGRFLDNISSKEKSNIMRKSAHFMWIRGNIFRLGPNHILRRCVRHEELFDVLWAYHDGPFGVHFSARRINFKVLQDGYYWTALHKYEKRYTSNVMSSKGWESQHPRMKFPYTLKWR